MRITRDVSINTGHTILLFSTIESSVCMFVIPGSIVEARKGALWKNSTNAKTERRTNPVTVNITPKIIAITLRIADMTFPNALKNSDRALPVRAEGLFGSYIDLRVV